MIKLPENLAFRESFGWPFMTKVMVAESDERLIDRKHGYPMIWTRVPMHDGSIGDGKNTFFATPLFASEKTRKAYGETTILVCKKFVQEQALQLNGIYPVQALWDVNDKKRPYLWLMEEADRGRGVANGGLPDDRPRRVIAVLQREEFEEYCKKGDTLVGMKQIGE